MLTTTNYGLKKPEGTDVVNIDDFNGNADIIDTKLKEINSALPLKAPLDSPGLTGAPTAPTQTAGDNSTKIANTAFVTAAVANKTSISGNAGTATKIQTPRNIALAGDVTGSADFDGSRNISITTTVADDSHNHIIANVDGLQSALNAIDTQLLDMVYQTAGGSATAITLTIKGTLVNGYPITFIASANNGGAAITINGKKLYKPGTTTSPNLIAGKAYTVWYNSTGDCFFIKASAEGTALAKDVRRNTTFSNDNDTGITGGLDLSLLVPGNIRAGITIDGVTGKSSVVDTADALLDPQYLLKGYSGYDDGVKKFGTLENMTSAINMGGADSGDFYNSSGICGGVATNEYVGAFDLYIPKGYYSGTGTNRLHIPNLMPWNIVNGVNIGWNGKSIVGTASTYQHVSGALDYTIPRYSGTSSNHTSYSYNISLNFVPDLILWLQASPKGAYVIFPGFSSSPDNFWFYISNQVIYWYNDSASSFKLSGSWHAWKFS
ncbi:hypothetical protein [Clostridium beijerinckii]|jgi:hypothetical protein|uniref:Tail fiber protein n=2 Tax=Clostridium beijerinckii TaxID=1520 RepID=A6LRY0_CLOB8|nr:hypothetical protein [Clostridium beijerinckii]ABR33110.1 hypothetical protein Cbei_0926 [Clostridium beijerinckii NCIMB 8052]AIU01332.1 hypothetical protein Cbs_0926 [Clostridium beijerinckii ATCC 35702]NRT25643.1 hypothetical protein [Clostridium beijerinckii]NRT66762.1 hypothetical protein [Clostridium beijerinckii]NRT81738.1 hypothetical protein [Clostridium beijerinckii]